MGRVRRDGQVRRLGVPLYEARRACVRACVVRLRCLRACVWWSPVACLALIAIVLWSTCMCGLELPLYLCLCTCVDRGDMRDTHGAHGQTNLTAIRFAGKIPDY